ncbi:SPOR domain-containing protein [Sphingomonas donggukensis]|uniref:SPOR domain-containing protein n=1 Tax=Sphingomonas donggukensis TaxID=2949093 RepID=A0ABY4TWW8_9SPHN|nr:SPOR domain-containing protein [Sphingomonas donggukensis]URW76905.1 SPOR domain-containing protein [Sphingomonas donggukensis]
MNTTTDGEQPAFAEDDRLPWLESAEDEYREGPSAGRVIGLIVAGLVVIAAAIWGFNYFRTHRAATGSGELIAAQEGDYKVKPDEPGGMKVDGEGDSVFRASEGAKADGTINTRAVPEAPVAGKTAKPAPKAGAGSATVVANVPAAGGRLTAQAPAMPTIRASKDGSGSALVQLGSFPSEAAANAAWDASSKRFGYVASLGKSIEKADVNGRTVYRLRVNAGSNGNANTICGKLKVAGEACFVPN